MRGGFPRGGFPVALSPWRPANARVIRTSRTSRISRARAPVQVRGNMTDVYPTFILGRNPYARVLSGCVDRMHWAPRSWPADVGASKRRLLHCEPLLAERKQPAGA